MRRSTQEAASGRLERLARGARPTRTFAQARHGVTIKDSTRTTMPTVEVSGFSPDTRSRTLDSYAHVLPGTGRPGPETLARALNG